MVGRKCSYLLALGGIALCLLAPGRSSAQTAGDPAIIVDDFPELIQFLGTSPFGFDPSTFTMQVVQEGIGVPNFGIADLHGEWADVNPLDVGETISVNFHLIEPIGEPNPGSISDTINVVLTGHTPNGHNNNMSVDFHFRSDTLDGIAPPGLTNPIALIETGRFQDLTPFIRDATSVPGGRPGLENLQVFVRSDVPEPGSMAMLGGIAISGGLMVWRRRRR